MKKDRLIYLIILLVLIPAGILTKFYTGAGEAFVHKHLGGVLYEVFFIVLILFIKPDTSPWIAAAGVFIATSGIEFLQLVHTPFLDEVRNTFVGATLLGRSFSWYDFPWYLAGSLSGAVITRWISHINTTDEK